MSTLSLLGATWRPVVGGWVLHAFLPEDLLQGPRARALCSEEFEVLPFESARSIKRCRKCFAETVDASH